MICVTKSIVKKKQMKIPFITSAFILTSCASVAQNVLQGSITDGDNVPLAGTTVYILEISRGTITDSSGHYIIKGIPNGKVKVQFSFVGYSSVMEAVNFQGSKVDLNVAMHQSPIEAEAIVISGGYSSTQHQNAVKIDVLTMSNQREKPLPNFAQMLTSVPGVDMISKGNGVSKPTIRGLSMNDILVLNNGVRFENYQYSDHHPLGIDEFGIEDVEIVKGPASLLFGSDAIGGVLNFIKERPAPAGTISGDYNVQLHSVSRGIVNSVGVKGASENFFGGIRLGQKSHSDYLQGGGSFVPNSRFNEYSVKSNVGYTGGDFTTKVFYDCNRQNLGLVEPEAVESITGRERKTDIFYEQLNTHLLSTQTKLFLGRSKVDVNVSYQSTELIHFGEEDEYELQMRLGTLIYEMKLYLPSSLKSEYIVGFQGMNQENSNLHNRATILLPDASTNSYSVFGLVQQTYFERLKLQAGLRFDYRDIDADAVGELSFPSYRAALQKDYSSFSGSFGGTFRVNEKLLFRANAASAFRNPNLAELTSNGPHEGRYEMGDKSLDPEKSFELDASMHYHSNNFLFDIAAYRNWINDYIAISPTGQTTTNGLSIYQYMQGNSVLYGGEAGMHFNPASLSWLHLKLAYSMVVGERSNGDNLPFIPAKKITAEVGLRAPRLFFLEDVFLALQPYYTFKQDDPAPEEPETSDYFLFDIFLGGNICIGNQHLVLVVGVNNLFDKKYLDHLSTLKEVNLNNPGRNISLSMRIPFEL